MKGEITMDERKIKEIIKTHYGEIFVDYKIPKPYIGKGPIKAILLGNDPGNNFDGETKRFEYAFALTDDSRYFRIFRENIAELDGITIDNLYIQNLCKNYFNCDTSKNASWKEVAKLWMPCLKEEFDSQFSKNVPILASSYVLIEAILEYGNSQKIKLKPKDFYQNCSIIERQGNYFDRDIIPFFRHKGYKMVDWQDYKNFLNEYFKGVS